MAAPTYNCPFSSTGHKLTQCNLLVNTNCCALYDTVDEQCMFRQSLLSEKDFWRGEKMEDVK